MLKLIFNAQIKANNVFNILQIIVLHTLSAFGWILLTHCMLQHDLTDTQILHLFVDEMQ